MLRRVRIPTIADYIAENKIQETGIKMGDPTLPW